MSNFGVGDIFEVISQKRRMPMSTVSMKHIYKVIYNLSVYIKTFDLR